MSSAAPLPEQLKRGQTYMACLDAPGAHEHVLMLCSSVPMVGSPSHFHRAISHEPALPATEWQFFRSGKSGTPDEPPAIHQVPNR